MTTRFSSNSQTSRHATVIALLAIMSLLTGCTPASGGEAETSLLPMTIVEWLFPPAADFAEADPLGVTQVSWTPMHPGENTITVTLTDLYGDPLPELTATSELEISVRALAPDAEPQAITLTSDGPTWTAADIDLPEANWYQLDIRLLDGGDTIAESRTWAMLPDPTVYGADAVELPESDLEAVALYERALATYGSWDAARWRESLSSGAGAVVVSEFAVTNRPGEPTVMRMDSRYVGAFRRRADGTEPSPPQLDYGTRITIGNVIWTRDDAGQWTSVTSREAASFSERAEIFAGATNVRAGGTAVVNGIETRIVTFYLPSKTGQSEAWFAWWIDPDTGNLLRLAMIAQMHFMVWDLTDINEGFSIERPAVDAVATPAPGDR